MTTTGAFAGGLAGLLLGPWLAALLHTAPQPGSWLAPWRPTGRRSSDTSLRDRVLVTAACVVGAGLAGTASGWTAAWPAFAVVGLAAGPLVVLDIRLHRLPDRIVLPTGLLAVALLGVAALATDDGGRFVRAVVAAVVVLAVLAVASELAHGAFGLGDVKTAAVLSLLLGWRSVPTVVLGLWVGFALAALAAVALIAARRASWRSRVAFGPALLFGALGTAAALATA